METEYLRNLSWTQKCEKLTNSQKVSQMKKNKKHYCRDMGNRIVISVLWWAEKSILNSKKINSDDILLFNILHFNKEDCLIFLTNNRNKSSSSELSEATCLPQLPTQSLLLSLLPSSYSRSQWPPKGSKSFLILFSMFRWSLQYSSSIVNNLL